ncbi:hypothetical protein ACG04Q_09175 [Roseateles sp. DXS20W]|uniref:Beta-barrel porin 2 n=2 Tax=Pelomonas lactea TaxID=3299030 RepID=A0ABW7GIU7_9BURK
MPTKPPHPPRISRLALLVAMASLAHAASAQTDDAAPFYAGGSLGVSHVSNVYRQTDTPNSDSVISAGLLAGIDQRFGRQHLKLDTSLQNNRYRTNSALNYRAYSIAAALNWQTAGNLSGVLSAKSEQTLADFNIGNGINPIFKKNIEKKDEYKAVARLGLATRYLLEGAWVYRRKNFTAEEYNRFIYNQHATSLGAYLTPAGNLRLGLVLRRTDGSNPRYPAGFAINPDTAEIVAVTKSNKYVRNDFDFTTRWSVGGHSTLNTRVSRSNTKNSLNELVSDFSGTTGAIGWTWVPSAKLRFELQHSRDTGLESAIRSSDLNRIYTIWDFGADYALTSKIGLHAHLSNNKARRTSSTDIVIRSSLDDTKSYSLGLRWAFYRGFSFGCQYDHVSRDSSIPQYVYSAGSYGCTGQALVY